MGSLRVLPRPYTTPCRPHRRLPVQREHSLLVSSHSPRILHWANRDLGHGSVYILRAGDGAAEVATYESMLENPGYGFKLNRAAGVDLANQMMDGF